jgi:putative spermidine/putrescine transport system ATP-binding protein
MADARAHALAISGVDHFFGQMQALAGISLAVAPGELIVLLGPSGCGKTTLLQIIAGFIRPTRGEVTLGGARIDHVPANRRRIGMVFQNYALFPHLSVFENVAYGLRARRAADAVIRTKVTEMLALVKMTDFAGRYPSALSGGQQQRVALARAMAIEPDVVLLDEPFSALDKNLRLDMQIEIKSLFKGAGITSIMVTHDQEEALSMADRIAVMSDGRIEQIDTPNALYDRPISLFVNRFIGHSNFLRGTMVSADRVRLDAGVELPLSPSRRFRPDAPVIVAVRPENCALAKPTQDGVPATIRVTLPLGPSEVIEAVTPSGEHLKIHRSRSPTTPVLEPGAAVCIRFADPTGVGVFSRPNATLPVTTGDIL